MSQLPKKIDRRIVRSKIALKQALLTLMSERGYDDVSITDIVERADYNRGTFYTHYDNKDALLSDIIHELILELLKSFRAPYEHQAIFRISEMSANSIKIFEHIHEHAAVYSTLLQSNVATSLREHMFQALKQISMEELVYSESGIDPDLQAAFSIHALLGLIFHWVESGFNHSPAYMQEQLFKMIHWHPMEAKTKLR
ncbi:TetR/AcrR family transcriptional regulator [Paenibacillus sp. OV219]|uniref:TetR/AcrR family transcriptional regulator n=1 Tax=Paenibacillus sp. OV219 TaxID=1884377 RepID=UPI0008CF485A|nr:TetR/AcrR family transcriptional regulator [Paenibacillus sp. OV219]SEP10393.1 transcriptional regulator, TetR family [Paenibacillus sp. OV219]